MSDPFLGEVLWWAPNFAPRGWAFCQGQLLAIAQNSALFSILGTVYGGDGRTTFGLPDLRSRVVVQQGSGPGLSNYALGNKTGQENVQLSTPNLPGHTHVLTQEPSVQVQATTEDAAVATPTATDRLAAGKTAGGGGINVDMYSTAAANTTLGGFAVTGAATTANTGNNNTHNNMQPYLALNYIIALTGTFPSRN